MQLDSKINGKVVTVSGRKFHLNVWDPSQDPVIGPMIAMDTETELIVDQTFPDLVLLQVTAGKRVDLVRWEDASEYIRKLIRYNPKSLIVFVNAAFDLGVLNEDVLYDLVESGQVVNLQDRYKIWEIAERGFVRKPDSLLNMARQVLGVELSKDENVRLTFTRSKDPTYKQLLYGADDVVATWILGDKIPEQPTEADSQIMGSIVLDAISRNGMLVDRDHFDTVRARFVNKMEKDLEYLEMHGYNPLLGKSSTDVLKDALKAIGIEDMPESITGPKYEYMLYKAWLYINLPFEDFKKRIELVIQEIDQEECHFLSESDYVDWYVNAKEKEFEGKLKRDRVAACRESLDMSDMQTIYAFGAGQRINPFKGKWRKRLNELTRNILDNNFMHDRGIKEPIKLNGMGLHDMATDAKLCLWPMASILREMFKAKAGKLKAIPEFNRKAFTDHIQKKSWWYGHYSTEWVDCLKPEAFIQARLRGIEDTNADIQFPRTKGKKDGSGKKIQASKKDQWIFKKYGIKDELIETFISYKHNEKIISTYLNPVHIKEDGRVHTRYENYLRTGRTASSKPNIQNVPGEESIRQMYVPKPMHLFASIDYSQLELCSLAQHCFIEYGHSRMMDLINAKIDLHSWFAGKTMGIINDENDYDGTPESRERVMPLIELIKSEHTKQRKNAKASNFGFPGGMSAETFLKTQRGYGNIDITIEECADLRESWFQFFPEMNQHMQPLSDIVTEYDRKRFDNDYVRLYQAKNSQGVKRRKCTYNSACNFPFQSLAALGAKRALWAVWRSKYGKYMVNFIHDEILFELPMETAAEDVLAIQEIMEDAMKEVIPDVRIEAEGCLMERWDKEAEPVYDLFGNLTIWQPEAAK
jgi:hypothetical protein